MLDRPAVPANAAHCRIAKQIVDRSHRSHRAGVRGVRELNTRLLKKLARGDEGLLEATLDDRVYAIAERLAHGPARAIRWSKASISIGLKRYAHSVMDTCLSYEMLTFATNDHREVVDVFVEMQRPEFKGG